MVYHDSKIPYLEGGFPLRCFQRLSRPYIATLLRSWRNDRYTRGMFTPVLITLIMLENSTINVSFAATGVAIFTARDALITH